MFSLSGVISDKLRSLLSSGKLDGKAVNPGRPASPAKSAKLPKGVQGKSMGRRSTDRK